jgi:hypothetical protein
MLLNVIIYYLLVEHVTSRVIGNPTVFGAVDSSFESKEVRG